jgi:hypothetical protein
LVIVGVLLAIAGISLAAATAAIPLWLLALLLAGAGIGGAAADGLGFLLAPPSRAVGRASP